MDFDEFWLAYPRKVGKMMAMKAWLRVLPSEYHLILPALEQQKKLKQWEIRKFIPHASTWLNQKRWQDSFNTDDFIEAEDISEAF